jgi:hypothetical protein
MPIVAAPEDSYPSRTERRKLVDIVGRLLPSGPSCSTHAMLQRAGAVMACFYRLKGSFNNRP